MIIFLFTKIIGECLLDDPFVKKIKFDGNVKQTEAYNDFLTKNHTNSDWEYEWAAFLDVDEFLVLKKHKNVKDFLHDYKDYLSVGINWVLFGNNNINEINGDYSVIRRFTKRQKGVDQHIKSIVKLTTSTKMLIHNPTCEWVNTDKNRLNGPFNKNGNDNVAQINHYFCKTIEEFSEKVKRGRADSSSFRKMDEYEPHNLNEIEDLTAYNFYFK